MTPTSIEAIDRAPAPAPGNVAALIHKTAMFEAIDAQGGQRVAWHV